MVNLHFDGRLSRELNFENLRLSALITVLLILLRQCSLLDLAELFSFEGFIDNMCIYDL